MVVGILTPLAMEVLVNGLLTDIDGLKAFRFYYKEDKYEIREENGEYYFVSQYQPRTVIKILKDLGIQATVISEEQVRERTLYKEKICMANKVRISIILVPIRLCKDATVVRVS